MVTATITSSDRTIIKSTVGRDNKIFAAAAGKIYFAGKGSKKWTQLKEAGSLTFYQSLDSGILYFCLVDLKSNGQKAWEQELYVDFKYYRDTDLFHSFEADGGMVGFLFADEDDADKFYSAVTEQLELCTTKKSDCAKKKKSRSIFSVFRFSSKKKDQDASDTESTTSVPEKKKKNDDLTHDDVSEPRDFRHLSHIGFNPEKGTFDVQNIPAEWKQLFDKAGITQDQLENKDTAEFIAGFVDQSKDMMVKRGAKKKPAPPPPKSKPSTSSGATPKKAAPPPPPKKKASAPAAKSSAPAPPGPPPPAMPSAGNGHSALLESIRSAGTKNLRHVDPDEAERPAPPAASDPHSSLMASIRSGTTLKKAPPRSESKEAASPTDMSDAAPSDMMAAMLAKALAARNKKLSMESDDESEASDDSRW